MPVPAPAAARVLIGLVLAVLALPGLAGGCALLGARTTVEEPAARDLLDRAVALAASPRISELCTLSVGEASTCQDTLVDVGALVPRTPPVVRCAVRVGDVGPLRGGMVLVLEGTDANDDPYLTEFVVYDDGSRVGVLDAVWWSGLSIEGYGEDTVTWRFDSDSTVCDDRALPDLS
jgi:hypothetical protein